MNKYDIIRFFFEFLLHIDHFALSFLCVLRSCDLKDCFIQSNRTTVDFSVASSDK